VEGKEWCDRIEKQLNELSLVKLLRNETIEGAELDELVQTLADKNKKPIPSELLSSSDDPKTTVAIPKWKESRPYANYPEEKRIHSLTAGTLAGPGKLAVPPLVFSTRDDSESIIILHLGRSMCGHDGIIHGGLVGTVLDETLARTAILSLPAQVGVTANLNINYRYPTFADQFVVIRSKLIKQEGRKAWVEARMEELPAHPHSHHSHREDGSEKGERETQGGEQHVESEGGRLLADATALFVQPKMAQILNNSTIRAAMGESS